MTETGSASAMTDADVDYIRANFTSLDELARTHGDDPNAVRAEIGAGRLPRPSYTLADGTEMVPPDYFELVDSPGGVERLREHFVERYAAAAAPEPEPLDSPEDEWKAYLTGDYGVCLREVTPENIARKSALVLRIDALLADARPEVDAWRGRLAGAVDELDALEREFAPYDRVRWGAVSRDRLVTAARERYPTAFEHVRAGRAPA